MATFTTSSGFAITVTNAGISSVKHAGNEMCDATSKTLLHDPDISMNSGSYTDPTISRNTVLIPNSRQAIVTQVYTGTVKALVVHKYDFDGVNDVTITTSVLNTGTTNISFLSFQPLKFLPDDTTAWYYASVLPTYDRSQYSQTLDGGGQDGVDHFFYPSSAQPVAISYVSGGVCNGQTVNFSFWFKEPLTNLTPCAMTEPAGYGGFALLVKKRIAPQETQIITTVIRFAATGTVDALCSGYKTYVQATGPLLYTQDNRPWGWWGYIDAGSVTPTNPYGYSDSSGSFGGRFDTEAGATHFQYYTNVLAASQTANMQGIMFWQPQGINPRGIQYRPDPWNWPPPYDQPSHAPWTHALTDPFTNAGLSCGIQTRPTIATVSVSQSSDNDYTTGDSPYDANFWVTGMKYARDTLGFKTHSYMDSFPDTAVNVTLLQRLRNSFGSSSQWYTEQSSLASLQYAGMYTQVGYASGAYFFGNGNGPLDRHALPTGLLRYLYPNAAMVGRIISYGPGGFTEALTWCFQNQISPFIDFFDIDTYKTTIANLVSTYIDSGSHRWL